MIWFIQLILARIVDAVFAVYLRSKFCWGVESCKYSIDIMNCLHSALKKIQTHAIVVAFVGDCLAK